MVALVAGPAIGAGDDSYPETPANRWVFEAMDKLKADGLVGEPTVCFPIVIGQKRLRSRYELAAGVSAAVSRYLENAQAVERRGSREELRFAQHGANLKDLVGVFWGELTQLGQDPARTRWMLTCLENELPGSTALKGVRVPDLPVPEWVEESLYRFKAHGIGNFSLMPPKTRLSRLDRALTVTSIVGHLELSVVQLEKDLQALALRPAPVSFDQEDWERSAKEQLSMIRGWRLDLPRLKRLVLHFAPELRKVGEDPAELGRKISRGDSRLSRLRIPRPGEALEPFKDVPASHWASPSLTSLRRNGLLRGYPSGQFGVCCLVRGVRLC
jgi:hypothetical protein